MKWSFAISLTSILLLCPLAVRSQDANNSQQSQDKPVVVHPALAREQVSTDLSPKPTGQLGQSMREHFRSCDQTLDRARDQAHKLSRDADQQLFSVDSLIRQHKQLQEQIHTLSGSRDQFLKDMSDEQQKSVQDHNQSMQQIHDRIQAHLQAIDQEFTGSNLHLKVVADEARAAEREMKSYHKHLQETAKAFNLLAD